MATAKSSSAFADRKTDWKEYGIVGLGLKLDRNLYARLEKKNPRRKNGKKKNLEGKRINGRSKPRKVLLLAVVKTSTTSRRAFS